MGLVILLLIVGAILLMIEAILPGMVAGLIGCACIAGGIYVAYDQLGPQTGSVVMFSSLIALGVGFVAWLIYFPKSKAGKVFVSSSAIAGEADDRSALLGTHGICSTRLNPSGFAIINGKKYDVVAQVGLLEPETPVEVVNVSGNRIVVRSLAT